MFTVIASILLITSCISKNTGSRLTLVQAKTPDPTATIPVKKGKFLDYIYLIQPDHKQEGYWISTDTLSKGYAHATGPYDGVFYQFFLFRGKQADLVFKQTTGYETKENEMLYGSRFEAFTFPDGKLNSVEIGSVLPLEDMEAVFTRQIEKLKQDESKKSWALYKLLRMPEEGTDVDLKVCRDKPEPPFATETLCVTVGRLKWNKQKFIMFETNKFPQTDETI